MVDLLAKGLLTIFGIIPVFVPGGECRDICSIYSTNYTYCEDGFYCCESNTKCCPVAVSFGAIVGLVIAGLFALTICIICAMFIVKKHHTRPNQLVSPSNCSRHNRERISAIGSYRFNTHRNFMARPPPYQPRPPDYPYDEAPKPPTYSEVIREQDNPRSDERPSSRPPSYKP